MLVHPTCSAPVHASHLPTLVRPIPDLATLRNLATLDQLHGFYEIDEALYHSAGIGLSQSRLKEFVRSPAHCRYVMGKPSTPNDDMIKGSATHCLVLEGEAEFWARYAKEPTGINRRSKAGKAKYAKALADNLGKTILPQKTLDQVHGMARALGESEMAMGILGMRAMREVTVYCRIRGVLCRSRLDLCDDTGLIFDFKTTYDARPKQFAKVVSRFRYDWQFGFYSLVYEAVTGVAVTDCTWLVVEPDPPHGIAAYRLADGDLMAARADVLPHIEAYGRCERDDKWPSYPETIQDLYLPGWSKR